MLLKQLLLSLPGITGTENLPCLDIKDICTDSRKARKSSLFIAIKGCQHDGTDFIHDVVAKGGQVIVVNTPSRKRKKEPKAHYLYVKDTKKFLRQVTQKFYADSAKMKTIGITGTNGKTTISYLLESFLKGGQKKCGVIGTINYRYAGKTIAAQTTTPGYLENHQILADMASRSIEYCVMEVSSHALDQGRVEDIPFKTAVFTNLTEDHLDYHRTIPKYFSSKMKLFTEPKPKPVAVINGDDPFGEKLAGLLRSKVITYGVKKSADVMAKDIFLGIDGSSFTIRMKKESVFVRTHLIGIFNVYNILAATAAALQEGITLESIRKSLRRFKCVPGRLEQVRTKSHVPVFIDYAHTPDALFNVLKSIRTVTARKILLVFGCGGDRDKGKRPQMGKIASLYADFSIVTSDNPRGEDPQKIIAEIITGFKNTRFMVLPKREKAIAKALKMAKANNIVLVVGKGHEPYQIFKDRVIRFDEKKIIKDCLNADTK